MDVFDRIAAALVALATGKTTTDPEVVSHLEAIDEHLQDDDTHNAAVDAHLETLDGDATEEEARIGTVEAGLQKIADALASVPTAAIPDQPAQPAPTSDTSPAASDTPPAVEDQPTATTADGAGIVSAPVDTPAPVTETQGTTSADGAAGLGNV